MKYLTGKDYRVLPVKPAVAGQEILGKPFRADLAAIPSDRRPVHMVDIFGAPDAAGETVVEAADDPIADLDRALHDGNRQP